MKETVPKHLSLLLCFVDIHCNDGAERLRIVRALIKAGFKRIGINKTFIHVDMDVDKNNSIWVY